MLLKNSFQKIVLREKSDWYHNAKVLLQFHASTSMKKKFTIKKVNFTEKMYSSR